MADQGQSRPAAAAAEEPLGQSHLGSDGEVLYPDGFAYLRGALSGHHADYVYGHLDASERAELAAVLSRMTWEQHAWIVEQAALRSICGACQGHGATDFGTARQRPCAACASGFRISGPLGFSAAGTFLCDRTLRPHLAALVAAAENWGEIKDRLFGTFTGIDMAAADGPVVCPCHPADSTAADRAVAPAIGTSSPRRALLLTLILFRRAYFSESIFKLRSIVNHEEAGLAEPSFAATRDRYRAAVAQKEVELQPLGRPYQGAGLVAQSVGSTDLTSDYDVTLSGVHDLAALAELNQSFRESWGKESGYLFDTNIYCRDYARVRDNIYPLGGAPKRDPCQQLESEERVGDLFGLTKIRRYTSKVEWRALVAAILRAAGCDGAPRFARVELADVLYRQLYVQPLLTRVAAVHRRFAAAALIQFAADHAGQPSSAEAQQQLATRITKQTPRTLERLVYYDSNSLLRACNLAFVELAARARQQEQHLRRVHAADPGVAIEQEQWRSAGDSRLERRLEPSLVSEAGLVALARSWGALSAESMMFAADAYYTQGAYWDVVGSQTGNTGYPLTVDHFLHCFNEQVGDALKELRQYQRMVDGDLEARKHMPKAHTSDPSAAHLGFYRSAKYADRMLACMDNILGRLYGTRSPEYRQIQARLAERNLKRDTEPRDLPPEPALQRRRDAWRATFPGRKSPDDLDLERLAKELLLTAIFGKNIPQLLLIRKARGEYAAMSLWEKKQRAKELVRATVGSDDFRAALQDPDRADAEPRYREAAGNPEAPTKYDAVLDDESQPDSGWGLRELTYFLLWHCAQVNKLVRRIRTRDESAGSPSA